MATFRSRTSSTTAVGPRRLLGLLCGMALGLCAGCSGPPAEPAAPSSTVGEPATAGGVGDTSTTAPAAADFTPATVRFDPDSPPPLAEIEKLTFAAAEADFHNSLWCWEHADVCDPERDLGPAAAESRLVQLRNELDTMREEGRRYRPGDGDAIHDYETLANSEGAFGFGDGNSFRILGQVRACEVHTGAFVTPDESGGVGEVVEEVSAVTLAEYTIWQHKAGGLQVGSRVLAQEVGRRTCDAYR